jgi:DnaJ family protein C protein 13
MQRIKQSLHFHVELSPYKYAGYPQLVKTIRMETWDETLFSKQAPLLSCASELAYHTVDCCALNAEELRREGGIDVSERTHYVSIFRSADVLLYVLQALLEALSRCVAVLGLSSKPTDCAVRVCCNVVQTLAVCAKSQACRDKMVELPRLVWEVCAVLQWQVILAYTFADYNVQNYVFLLQHLGELACHATSCVASLAADSILQMALVQCGALWPALSAMFGYDYTLEEGGVVTTEGASSQVMTNKCNAKLVYFFNAIIR